MSELAKWKCHKVVKAGRILVIQPGSNVVTVENSNGDAFNIDVGDNAFRRGRPIVGDYIVIYDDDYISWSPAKAFEDGYTRL